LDQIGGFDFHRTEICRFDVQRHFFASTWRQDGVITG